MTKTNYIRQCSKIFLVIVLLSAYPCLSFIGGLVKKTAREVLENNSNFVSSQEFELSHEAQRQHLMKVCHLSKTSKDLSRDERALIFNATYFDSNMIYDGKHRVAYCPILKVRRKHQKITAQINPVTFNRLERPRGPRTFLKWREGTHETWAVILSSHWDLWDSPREWGISASLLNFYRIYEKLYLQSSRCHVWCDFNCISETSFRATSVRIF